MGLTEYRRKRRFDKTPEPTGEGAEAKAAKKSAAGRSFVIQKHDASRLHYDFRLEHDGVLKSWAVPKGPSLDPKERRLAVQVEDHPIDYGDFEGIIPEGEYGGGTVLLWDHGTWEPVGDAGAGLAKGHLKFHLEGEKLHGGWALVRLRSRDGDGDKNWLLIKETDATARPTADGDILEERPESVASGRDLGEIAADPERVWSADGAKAAPTAKTKGEAKAPRAAKQRIGKALPLPEVVEPQLATLVEVPPAGDDWLFEIKLDGYRILAPMAGGEVKLVTRKGNDWSEKFPGVARALAELAVDSALFDGEVAALADDGRTSFQALQNALSHGRRERLVYFLFDLLHLNGEDLSRRPLAERKERLAGILAAAPDTLRFCDHVRGRGAGFFRQACKLELEGIIAKRADAPYRPGRTRDWLKIKCLSRQELVIGGFTDPGGARSDLGALLVGVYAGDELRYAGKVGTGFDADTLTDLRRRLEPLERVKAPFANPPRGAEARGVHWVEPKLVAEIAFGQWTDDDRLRHASFQGLREDKPAREVRRERPAATPTPPKTAEKATPARRKAMTANASAEVAGVTLSHPDRVLYPEQGLTKLDLAHYYEAIADWILPHVRNRPLSLVRCPEGSTKQCFYQKHLGDTAPDAVRSVVIEEDGGKSEAYPYVDDLAGVVALVQIGVLEIHAWGSAVDQVERPDRVVFDLDPDPTVPWKQVTETAIGMCGLLEELGLASFVQTTGGKGLHVVVPLVRRRSWDEVKAFARAIAEILVHAAPDRYLSKASKSARKGKIFIDWLRNARGATAIVGYSTRARPGAPVATPLSWDELETIKPGDFTVETVPGRLAQLKKDPWADFWTLQQSIRAEAMAKLGIG